MSRKPPTIQDVAAALGMHKSTVSLALSGNGNISANTRTRVMSAARELGYEPNPLAQRLAKGHANPALFIVTGGLDVGLATEKILLIQAELSQRSLEVPIYTCSWTGGEVGRSQAEQVRQFCRQQPRAIVYAGPMTEAGVYEELEAYQQKGGTVVSYDVPVPLECDQVVFDRDDNCYQAARFLLAQGHRRIGICLSGVRGGLNDPPNLTQSLRLRGFQRALAAFDLPVRDDWMFLHTTYERGGQELAQHFLSLTDRPTGLCVVNDYVALAFMAEIMRAGVRVPQDVSIVGHDNQPIAQYCPVPLTSATQPVEEIAAAVVSLLTERLAGSQEFPHTITVTGNMVVRDSVAPPAVQS